VSQRKKITMETITHPAPVGVLDECCVCGEVAPLGDFATTCSGKSYCGKHEREMLAEVSKAGAK
jgi:hypothetical protein